MYSGITSGRVLDGELLYTKILEVNIPKVYIETLNQNFSVLVQTLCTVIKHAHGYTTLKYIFFYSTKYPSPLDKQCKVCLGFIL